MADEEMDGLDGLDDFGDDFGDQLDSFMEGEGDDDGDSELDSFFEDLSTIDDLEVQDDAPEEAPPAPKAEEPPEDEMDEMEDADPPEAAAAAGAAAAGAAAAAAAVKPMPKPEKKKSSGNKKALLIPAIIASATGLLLGVITVAILYFIQSPSTEPEEIVMEEPPPVLMPEPVMAEPEPEPVEMTPPPPPKPAPPSPPKRVYYVQVGNCVHQECVDDYKYLLKRFGYNTRVDRIQESAPMTEILSTSPLGEEVAGALIDRINRENRMAGRAYRKEIKEGFLVSLGLFPDLDTANRVKNHLNQAYANDVYFKAERADQKILYFKVRAGGFTSRGEAERLKDLLSQKDKRFEGAFVVAMRR
jgi:hypothetical protein